MATSKKKDPFGEHQAQVGSPGTDGVPESNVWLAGLGAFAKAHAEGSKAFDALVKEGVAIQRKTQALAEDRLAEASKRMAEITWQVGDGALPWGRLEGIFEQRVARALGRLGMPPAEEIAELTKRMDRFENLLASITEINPTPDSASGKRRAVAKKPR